jgi:site-specific recombinase XerD
MEDLPETNMSRERILAIIKSMLNDVDRFLNETDYSPATAVSYGYHLKRLADWLDAVCIPPEHLNASLLRTYLGSHGWRNNCQRLAGNAAKSFLKWRYGATHAALSLKLPKDDSAPGRALDQVEVDRLLAVFDTTKAVGWRDLAMLALMVESGIREAEVCRLELDYLDLRKMRFDVLAKGRDWREGVFSPITAQYLDIWLNARKEFAYPPKCPYVFVSVNGKTKGRRMTPGGLRANFRKMGVRAELGKFSPHVMRRTMATLLILNGAPTRLVQELGGWSDIQMVERYTRTINPQQIEQYSPLCNPIGLSK